MPVLPPFGWTDNSAPDIDSANLELERQNIATWVNANFTPLGGGGLVVGKYTPEAEIAFGVDQEPDAAHPTVVVVTVVAVVEEADWDVELLVDGVKVTSVLFHKKVRLPAEGMAVTILVPAAKKWRANITGNTAEVSLHESHAPLEGGGGGGGGVTEAHETISIGTGALSPTSSTVQGVVIGTNAMAAQTTGFEGVTIGFHAGKTSVSSIEATLVGWKAGDGSKELTNSTAVGSSALETPALVANTTSIGWRSGRASTGQKCVYVGHEAGTECEEDYALRVDVDGRAATLIQGNFKDGNRFLKFNVEKHGFFGVNPVARPSLSAAGATTKQIVEALDSLGLVKAT